MVRLAGLLLALTLLPVSAFAEKRVALLIGNEAYGSEIGRLANPYNDVALLKQALKGLGFEVVTERDAGLRDLTRAVNAYTRNEKVRPRLVLICHVLCKRVTWSAPGGSGTASLGGSASTPEPEAAVRPAFAPTTECKWATLPLGSGGDTGPKSSSPAAFADDDERGPGRGVGGPITTCDQCLHGTAQGFSPTNLGISR